MMWSLESLHVSTGDDQNYQMRRIGFHWPRILRAKWQRWIVLFVAGVCSALGLNACITKGMLARAARQGDRGSDGVLNLAREHTLRPPVDITPRNTAVLLVHGFVGSGRDFADLPEQLASQGFTVRVMRLPGHGTRAEEFAGQTTTTLLDAVRQEYAALRGEHGQVAVVGFSMGGALATLLAAEAGPTALVLCAPYYGVTYYWFYGLRPETWNALFSPIIPYVYKGEAFVQVNRVEARSQIYSYKYIPTRGVALLTALGVAARDPGLLARIHCPVLMIAAEGDVAASPDAQRRAFAALGSGKKETVWFDARINHHVFWDYEAEAAKQAVVEFLKKNTP